MRRRGDRSHLEPGVDGRVQAHERSVRCGVRGDQLARCLVTWRIARGDRRWERGREPAFAPFRLIERVEVDDDRRMRRDVGHARAEDVRPVLLDEAGAFPFAFAFS